MLLSEAELAAVIDDTELPGCYFDPVLERSPQKYASFIAELYNCGVLGFTGTPRVVIGCFFVKKKNKKLRFIIDARRANRLFRRPPRTRLGSSECWSRVDLEEGNLFIAQEDVKDCFHRMGIDRALGEHFGLPAVDAGLLRIALGDHLPDDVIDIILNFGKDRVHPFLQVLPMGFSWAFHLAHEAHRSVALRADPAMLIVEDRAPVPSLRGGRPAALLYADNANHLGVDRERVDAQREAVSREVNAAGLDTHETVEATNLGESLGVRVDGLAGHTGPTIEKDSRLDAVLEGLERRPWVSGEQLRVVVGHMTIRALLDRNLLSILNHVYTFIEV